MFNIAIRADGGERVGMGHIMRCLAIAQQLKQVGCRVYFISRYQQGMDKVNVSGLEAYKLDIEIIQDTTDTGFYYGSSEELEEDLKKTCLITDKQGCDLLLVDKYNLTANYFNSLREFVPGIAFIDDLNKFKCSADIIINGNVNALQLGYKEAFQGQKLLLGSDYTPLRKEFSNIPIRKIKEFNRSHYKADCSVTENYPSKTVEIPEIQITTGGADPYNCTGTLIEKLLGDSRTAGMRYNVVVGLGFKYKSEIEKIAEKNTNIFLYINPEHISEIMLRSDLAISSGGSTLYELCCCGTPTLAFIMADNQTGIVKQLSDKGYIYKLGWYDQIENNDVTGVVSQMINDFNMRQEYSRKIQSLVDGKGAYRIAQAILETLKNRSIE
jgi:UDP-2,4-diacetamido-2,4,6-trideoxy-beta-L-altropyranose hydrolase